MPDLTKKPGLAASPVFGNSVLESRKRLPQVTQEKKQEDDKQSRIQQLAAKAAESPETTEKVTSSMKDAGKLLPKEEQADFNTRLEDVKKLFEAGKKRNQWGEVAEKVGHALAQLAAGYQGLQTGVDMSGLKFDKTDWGRKYDNLMAEYKQEAGILEREATPEKKLLTKTQSTRYITEEGNPIIFDPNVGAHGAYIDSKSNQPYKGKFRLRDERIIKDPETGNTLLVRGGEVVRTLKEGTRDVEGPPIESFKDIKAPTRRNIVRKKQDEYRKALSKTDEFENQIKQLDYLVKRNIPGTKGLVSTMTARVVAMERGALADKDVERAELAGNLLERIEALSESFLGDGRIAPERVQNMQDVIDTSRENIINYKETLDSRFTDPLVEQFEGRMTPETATKILSGRERPDFEKERQEVRRLGLERRERFEKERKIKPRGENIGDIFRTFGKSAALDALFGLGAGSVSEEQKKEFKDYWKTVPEDERAEIKDKLRKHLRSGRVTPEESDEVIKKRVLKKFPLKQRRFK